MENQNQNTKEKKSEEVSQSMYTTSDPEFSLDVNLDGDTELRKLNTELEEMEEQQELERRKAQLLEKVQPLATSETPDPTSTSSPDEKEDEQKPDVKIKIEATESDESERATLWSIPEYKAGEGDNDEFGEVDAGDDTGERPKKKLKFEKSSETLAASEATPDLPVAPAHEESKQQVAPTFFSTLVSEITQKPSTSTAEQPPPSAPTTAEKAQSTDTDPPLIAWIENLHNAQLYLMQTDAVDAGVNLTDFISNRGILDLEHYRRIPHFSGENRLEVAAQALDAGIAGLAASDVVGKQGMIDELRRIREQVRLVERRGPRLLRQIV